MFFLLCFALITWALSCADSMNGSALDGSEIKARIFEGHKASDGQFPFIAFIKYENLFVCTGSLIHVKYVLTAAHCTYDGTEDYQAENYLVVVGCPSVTKNKIDDADFAHKVSHVYTHPNYSSSLSVNDIGVLRLAKSVKISKRVALVKMIGYKSERPVSELNLDQYRCFMMGFGITYDNPTLALPFYLEYGSTYIVNPVNCKIFAEGYNSHFEDNSICTYYPETRSTCRGDTGGPLLCGHYLYGVASYLREPSENCTWDSFSVYTRVDKACLFLSQAMSQDVEIFCSEGSRIYSYIGLVLLSQLLLY